MSTFTKRIDSGLRMVKDNYISIRTPQWTATQNTSSFAKYTEEELFPGEFYGGIHNGSFRFTGVTIPPGATITSAKITFTTVSWGGSPRTVNLKIVGIDEDNTAEFVTSPIDTGRTRAHTSAAVDWDTNFSPTVENETFDSADFTSVVQEIIDRGGWASGNALGVYIYDDGTTLDKYIDYKYYSSYPTLSPLLTITYETPNSPSVSPSASQSPSRSPSASVSPSASLSRSVSPSVSRSPSPSPADTTTVLEIAKDGVNILNTNNPQDMKFSSRYGTLKYFTKSNQILTVLGSAGDFSGKKIFTHNLGYYPYAEVFVRTYIGSPSGNYQYCPFFGAGASVAYQANYIIKENTIELYGEFNGVSSSDWVFDFLVFLYKNRLKDI